MSLSGCGRIGVKLLDLPVQGADGEQDEPFEDAGQDAALREPDAGPLQDGRTEDAGPSGPTGPCTAGNIDGDRWCDDADNCIAASNDDQADFDVDGEGDVCDDDDDNDGTPDGSDACPHDALRAALDACGCNVAPPPTRRALWMLDESSGGVASEATGSAPSGTLTNLTGMPWTTGRVDGALSFDGVDDYVQVGAAGNGIRSLSFWAKPASSTVTTNLTGVMFPSATGPNQDWSNPQNAFSEGGGNATCNLNLIGNKYQHWGGFHIPAQLPPGVNVLGITVVLKSATFGVISGIGVELSWDGGGSHTSAGYGGTALIGSNNLSTYGGETQTWGHSWQAQELSDANFRVRVKLGGLLSLSASVDYVSVQVKYSDYAHPRNIMNLNATAKVEFVNDQMGFAATGWPGATTYVNGVAGGTLGSDWNHVVITGAQAISADQLQFGNVTSEAPNFPFHGLLDDVTLFNESLSAEDVGLLFEKPKCGL